MHRGPLDGTEIPTKGNCNRLNLALGKLASISRGAMRGVDRNNRREKRHENLQIQGILMAANKIDFHFKYTKRLADAL